MSYQTDSGSEGKSLIRVRPRGFCAGVVRAVDIVELALQAYGPPVYVHHEIVHKPVRRGPRLRQSGPFLWKPWRRFRSGRSWVFSAHGVPPTDARRGAAARGCA